MPNSWGPEMRSRRVQRGLSQGRLAQILGVDQPSISRWENGAQVEDDETLARIAAWLERDPLELLEERGRTRAGADAPSGVQSRLDALERQLDQVLELLEELRPSARKAAGEAE